GDPRDPRVEGGPGSRRTDADRARERGRGPGQHHGRASRRDGGARSAHAPGASVGAPEPSGLASAVALTDHADDLDLALRLGRLTSDIALDFYERDVATEIKDDGSPVTEADLAIEAELISTLAKERPDDAILSEECGA